MSWYVYSGGSNAAQWSLKPGLVEVTAVSPMPNMWQDGFKHHGEGVLLVLAGCRDTRNDSADLFPELLKSEYHSVRATIEAYSHRAKLEDQEEASACGLAVRQGSRGSIKVRVRSRGVDTDYTIDRWD